MCFLVHIQWLPDQIRGAQGIIRNEREVPSDCIQPYAHPHARDRPQGKNYRENRAILGTHTSESDQNYLVRASEPL